MKIYFCGTPEENGLLPYFILLLIKRTCADAEWVDSPQSADLSVFFFYGPKEQKIIETLRRQGRPILSYSGESGLNFGANWHRHIRQHRIPSITMDQSLVQFDAKRHLLIPLWVAYYHVYRQYFPQLFLLKKDIKKDRFCCFLHRDARSYWLEEFISCYQKTDLRDRFLLDLKDMDFQAWEKRAKKQNFDFRRIVYSLEKLVWFSRYRFSACRENVSLAHYHTEKLMDAIIAGTVCFYYGHKTIFQDFNPRAFVYVANPYSGLTAPWKIRRLSQDAQRCQAMLNEPMLRPGVIEDKYSLERLGRQLSPLLP